MSDAATHPPVRILPDPASVQSITPSEAFARIDAFLTDFQQRSTPLNGGDATVPAQLSKVRESLREETGTKAEVKVKEE